MKTTIISTALFFILFALQMSAQDRTTVNATSSEISDNLDLRAIASIFGDAKNLEDFERQLNDPKIQISNLDLNDDNQVDYLRVIESVEGNTHLIIVQSVLGRDTYQDVATIEVEKDRNNQVQVQVVGDVYMYGQNYIYEPIYVATPIIYSSFY
jgi:cystathionine beta-lyase family protein involved in aluminum resistance